VADRLAGKVAIVTGAAQGIGEAMVRALHAEGARVTVADISGQEEPLASELGDGALAVHVDVTDDASVEAAVKQTLDEFGRLDVICNNAGINGDAVPTADYPPEAFDRVLAVNTRGVYSGARHAIPAMLPSGGGSIINTASTAGLVAVPGYSAYCASKGAIIALTRCIAVEYGKAGIRCNAICPGGTDTPMLRAPETDDPEQFAQMISGVEAVTPLGRIGQPPDIAALAVFLASDESAYITGVAIPIDGGYTSA
jgi:NAD(P)-dependent dehydrogenase (short-subunit alcohol dehydrogenase family)